MPIGLQTFDANGNLTLDTNHRIGKIIASFDSGTTNASLTVPGLLDAGTPFHFVTTDADYFAEYLAYPDITITGITVSWTFVDYEVPTNPFGAAPRRSVHISVGVF